MYPLILAEETQFAHDCTAAVDLILAFDGRAQDRGIIPLWLLDADDESIAYTRMRQSQIGGF